MKMTSRRYAEAFLAAAESAPAEKLPKLAQRLTSVLRQRRQSRLFRGILLAVERLWDERHGTVPVRVTTARPIERTLITDLFGPDVRVDAATDEQLIGGAIVERGDERLDATVRRSLTQLKRELERKD